MAWSTDLYLREAAGESRIDGHWADYFINDEQSEEPCVEYKVRLWQTIETENPRLFRTTPLMLKAHWHPTTVPPSSSDASSASQGFRWLSGYVSNTSDHVQ